MGVYKIHKEKEWVHQRKTNRTNEGSVIARGELGQQLWQKGAASRREDAHY